MRGWRFLMLAGLLLVPSAQAAEGHGVFLVDGDYATTSAAKLNFTAIEAFLRDTSHLEAVQGYAPSLLVREVSRDYASPKATPITVQALLTVTPNDTTHRFTDATVSLTGEARGGFIGIYPRGPLQAEVETSSPAIISPALHTRSATRDANTPDGPTREWYDQTTDGPHLLVHARGSMRLSGPMEIKFYGPSLELRTPAERAEYETGVTRADELHERSAILNVESANLTITFIGDLPWEMTTRELSTAPAPAHFFAHVGDFQTSEGETVALRQETEIRGTFQAHLSLGAADSGIAIQAALVGDVASGISTQSARLATSRQSVGLFVALALVATGGGIGATMILKRRRKVVRTETSRASPLEQGLAASYSERAEEAASSGQWEQAVDLLRRAANVDPWQEAVLLREGMYLHMAGQHAAAIERLEIAATRQSDGEPEFWAAMAAMRMERPDLAETFIERCLERETDPQVLGLIKDDPLFAACFDDAEFAKRYARAAKRAEERGHVREEE